MTYVLNHAIIIIIIIMIRRARARIAAVRDVASRLLASRRRPKIIQKDAQRLLNLLVTFPRVARPSRVVETRACRQDARAMAMDDEDAYDALERCARTVDARDLSDGTRHVG